MLQHPSSSPIVLRALQVAPRFAPAAEQQARSARGAAQVTLRAVPGPQDLESRKRAPLYQKRQEDELKAATEKAQEAEIRAQEAEIRAKEMKVKEGLVLQHARSACDGCCQMSGVWGGCLAAWGRASGQAG